jgi:hypothetical protein
MKAETRDSGPTEEIKAEIANLEKEIERHHADNIAYMAMDPKMVEAAKEEFRLERLAAGRIDLLKKKILELNVVKNAPEVERRLELIRKAAQEAKETAEAEKHKLIKILENIEAAREKYNLAASCLGSNGTNDIFGGVIHTGRVLKELIQDINDTAKKELPLFTDEMVSSSRWKFNQILESGGELPAERTPEQVKEDTIKSKKLYDEAMAKLAKRQ